MSAEKPPQMTAQTLAILAAMLERPTDEWYGSKLSEKADLKSGTTYPALARLERAEWLSSHWEDVNPSEEGRPRRRLYELTGEGEIAARQALNEHLAKVSLRPGLRIGLRPGVQPA